MSCNPNFVQSFVISTIAIFAYIAIGSFFRPPR